MNAARAPRKKISIDFETRSAVDLRKAGVDVYASDASTDALCLAWAVDDAPVEIWRLGDPMPFDLFFEIEDGAEVYAWNAPFEWHIWNLCCVPKYGWPPLPIEQLFCSMAMSYAMAMPGKLENCAIAIGSKLQKDMTGNRVMMQLSQPRAFENGKTIWWRPSQAKDNKDLAEILEKFEKLYNYCIQDVEVEREIAKNLVPLSRQEREIWLLDFEINRRGVRIDASAVLSAMALLDFEKEFNTREMRRMTGNMVSTPDAVAQIKFYLESKGLDVPSLAKADVLDMLALDDLPDDCRRVLELRKSSAKSSTAKLDAMFQGASNDGRVRGCFQYHGAATGRWSGRRIQLQNLPRSKIKQDEIEKVFELLGRVEK